MLVHSYLENVTAQRSWTFAAQQSWIVTPQQFVNITAHNTEHSWKAIA